MHAGVRGSGQFLALLQVVHSVEPWTLSLTSAPYLGKGRGDKYLCFGFFLAQVRSPAVECLYMVGTQNAVIISFIRPKINFKDGWISKRILNRTLGSRTQ